MSKKTLHIAIVLDRSSSMWYIRTATVRALNKQIETLHNIKDVADIRATINTFSSVVDDPIIFDLPIKELKKLRGSNYSPSGSTALNDGIAITALRLMGKEHSKDDEFLMVVVTDGQENNSLFSSHECIKNLISYLKMSKKWNFAFLASNNVKEYFVKNYGINKKDVRIFESNEESIAKASEDLSNNLENYIRVVSSENKTEDDDVFWKE